MVVGPGTIFFILKANTSHSLGGDPGFLGMLKHQSATAVLQISRITLASTTSSSLPVSQSAKMSTADGSVRPQQARSVDRSEELKQQKPERQPNVYFPLGYKEAAYQWVRYSKYLSMTAFLGEEYRKTKTNLSLL